MRVHLEPIIAGRWLHAIPGHERIVELSKTVNVEDCCQVLRIDSSKYALCCGPVDSLNNSLTLPFLKGLDCRFERLW